jgi:hypothetical protein
VQHVAARVRRDPAQTWVRGAEIILSVAAQLDGYSQIQVLSNREGPMAALDTFGNSERARLETPRAADSAACRLLSCTHRNRICCLAARLVRRSTSPSDTWPVARATPGRSGERPHFRAARPWPPGWAVACRGLIRG